jgi:hypothetical protein
MAKRFLIACAAALSLCGCGSSDGDTSFDESITIDDPDGKADGIVSGLLSTSVVNGAKSRIYAKLSKVPSSSLSSLLVGAAKRGVDVEIYLVQAKPAKPDAVLGAQHLEASGVHVIADRDDNCAFDAIVDNQLRTIKSSTSISTCA